MSSSFNQQTNQSTTGTNSSKKSKLLIGCIIGIVLILGLCGIGGLFLAFIASNSSDNTGDTQAQKTAFTETELQNLSQKYCDVRKDKNRLYPVVSLSEDLKSFKNEKQIEGTKLTIDDCKTIMNLFDKGFAKGRVNYAEEIVNGKWSTGMHTVELYISVGLPDKVNVTYADGENKSQQLIYGDPLKKATYIYTENNKVTSFQEF